MSGHNHIVLSFHETLLRQSDIDLLSGPYWLNDTSISFFFEYLEKEIFATGSEHLFVSPEVTQCVKMVKAEEIGVFLDPLQNENKNFIFFTLNDNDHAECAGGSHWSLLVYSRPENYFFHLDSSVGGNREIARQFARHITPYFSKSGVISYEEKPCTQQDNSYDCGVHVTINAELLALYSHKHNQIASCNTLAPVSCSDMRKRILKTINDLAKKGNL